MENFSGKRRVQRVRHEIRRRDVEVARVSPVGAGFVSVTFKGDELDGFVSQSFDDHVKFIFTDADGEQVWRDYTPRYFNREQRELTIEFASHGDGKATDWAGQAAAGQRAVIAGPRGSMIIPADYDWHLLAGDETALPAISRRLEELPVTARATVIILGKAGDRRDFSSNAQRDVQWVDSPEALLAALRETRLPERDGFAWAAGEASIMKQIREILARKGMPKESMRVAAYWKKGASSFHENLD